MQQRTFTELPPLSLYIHIPWCVRKCPYCDFNSHELKEDLPESEYVSALLADLTQELPRFWGRSIASVFIGGGTPSLFSAESLDNLMSGIRSLTALAPNVEVTMEANPGTVEQGKFHEFRALGINRLSLGIQSFNDTHLKTLGRIHSASEAIDAVEIAHKAGFDNFNLDLMFGLPEQTPEQALSDLQQAIHLKPTHLSYYELTLEPNTLFAKYPPSLPHDDNRWAMQEEGIALMQQAGYSRYEISAYSQAGKTSAHNTNYWLFGDYIGIGAGAHGKLSFADSNNIVRRSKLKHPTRFLSTAGSDSCIGEESVLSIEDTALEFMMNALRLIDGFSIPLFQQHTGVSLDLWQRQINAAIDDGLLEQHGLTIRPTEQGRNFLNNTLAHFLETEAETRRYPRINIQPV